MRSLIDPHRGGEVGGCFHKWVILSDFYFGPLYCKFIILSDIDRFEWVIFLKWVIFEKKLKNTHSKLSKWVKSFKIVVYDTPILSAIDRFEWVIFEKYYSAERALAREAAFKPTFKKERSKFGTPCMYLSKVTRLCCCDLFQN